MNKELTNDSTGRDIRHDSLSDSQCSDDFGAAFDELIKAMRENPEQLLKAKSWEKYQCRR